MPGHKAANSANKSKGKHIVQCLHAAWQPFTRATCMMIHASHSRVKYLLHEGYLQGRDGRLQLSEQSTDLTWVSLRTIYAMSAAARGSEANLLRADLPALLTKIIQCPACWKLEAGVADQAVACLHAFTMSPAGKQQVLQQLTPAVIDALMAVALRWLQDPGLEYGHYAVAAGEVPAHGVTGMCGMRCVAALPCLVGLTHLVLTVMHIFPGYASGLLVEHMLSLAMLTRASFVGIQRAQFQQKYHSLMWNTIALDLWKGDKGHFESRFYMEHAIVWC